MDFDALRLREAAGYFSLRPDDRTCFVFCKGPDSFARFLKELQDNDLTEPVVDTVIIDQILVTGDGVMRFITGNVTEGKVAVDSLRAFAPELSCRKISSELCRRYWPQVVSSILTAEQRERIQAEQPL